MIASAKSLTAPQGAVSTAYADYRTAADAWRAAGHPTPMAFDPFNDDHYTCDPRVFAAHPTWRAVLATHDRWQRAIQDEFASRRGR